MIKRIPLILFFLVNTTAIADTSHAYANAVLDALQKKGILNAQEVADIKKQALVAEEKAMQTATKPKQTILTKTTKNITAVKQQVNRASPNIKIEACFGSAGGRTDMRTSTSMMIAIM